MLSKNILNNYSFFKILLVSFNKYLKFNFKYVQSNIFSKKFLVIKAPFKYNATKEQYILIKYLSSLKLYSYLPKIYEIFFYKYLFISNNKFFYIIRIEKGVNY